MLVVLAIALLGGIAGFVFHTLWVASIVVLALGLGYVVANLRQERREVVEQGDGEESPVP